MKANTTELMKFKRLQRLLGESKRGVTGLLTLLWMETARQAPEGDIGKFSNEEIAILLDWEDDPDHLVLSLVETGWLDRSDPHRLVVHDWSDHCPNYIKGNLLRHGRSIAIGGSSEEVTKEPPIGGCSEDTTIKSSLFKSSQVKSSQRGGDSQGASSVAPLPFSSDRFVSAWNDWQQHRKEIKKKLTPTSIARQFKTFEKWGESRSVEAIEYTIEKGWTGIREPERPDGPANGNGSLQELFKRQL